MLRYIKGLLEFHFYGQDNKRAEQNDPQMSDWETGWFTWTLCADFVGRSMNYCKAYN